MARSYLPKTTARSFVVGIGVVAAIAVIMYVSLTANEGRLPGTPTTTVRAEFADVGQLQTNSDVRQNGVFVGRVSDIEVNGGHALVTLQLNGDVPIYEDAYAGIWDQSALAQKFVELRAGTPGRPLLGDRVLPESQTESTHDLVNLLDVFQPDTRAALGSSLRTLGGGLAGYGPGLHDFIGSAPKLLGDVGTVSRTLTSPEADLPALLRTSDRLMSRFRGREAQIDSLLGQTARTMQALNVDDGEPLDTSLRALPRTLVDVRTAFNSLEKPVGDTGAAMNSIKSGASALGDATPDVRGVLREAPQPLNSVPDVAESVQPALQELSHTFSDARPFVPRLADGLSSAATPLAVLSPYARDIGTFSFDIGNLIENHDGWEHRLRIMVAPPALDTVAGGVVKDSANPYPAPGQAIRDRDKTGALIPGSGR